MGLGTASSSHSSVSEWPNSFPLGVSGGGDVDSCEDSCVDPRDFRNRLMSGDFLNLFLLLPLSSVEEKPRKIVLINLSHTPKPVVWKPCCSFSISWDTHARIF